MSRKDFELIARVLNAANTNAALDLKDIGALAQRFADELRATNAAFNRDKFLRACGVH